VKPTVSMALKTSRPWRAERFDPFRVDTIHGLLSVGGRHQKRALAHGYSI